MAPPAPPKTGRQAPTEGSELDRRLFAFTGELDFVYRSLRRYGVGPVDAEDLTQEVFLIAWRRRSDFDQSRPARPWLAGIAFKVAHQHHRRASPEIPQAVVPEVNPPQPPDLQADALDARALALESLARLPERHRTVLVLHELGGLSVDTIAAHWSVPRFTVYTRLRRARAAFAKEMERLQEDPGSAVAKAGALAPAQLLGVEGEPPPVPPALRDRVIERLRTEAALPVPPEPAPPSPPRVGRLVGAGVGAAVVVTLAVVLPRGTAEAPHPPGPPLAGSRSEARAQPARPGEPRLPVPPARNVPALTTTAPPLSPDLARDLTGFWRFDDEAGSSRAADRSIGGHHCELHQLDPTRAWIPGVTGGGIELGFDGWLECPQPHLPPRRTAALSVALWVKRAGNPHMNRALAMRPMGERRANYFFFGFDGDQLKVHSSGWSGILSAPFREHLGRWVHVAFTHDADLGTRLYVAGAEVARSRSGPRRFGAVQGPLLVGAGLNGPERDHMGQRFEGAIDELLVYERALSGEEIAELARTGAPHPGR
jgi:RNA polymerase sigma-70 factor (ECF subfamily)